MQEWVFLTDNRKYSMMALAVTMLLVSLSLLANRPFNPDETHIVARYNESVTGETLLEVTEQDAEPALRVRPDGADSGEVLGEVRGRGAGEGGMHYLRSGGGTLPEDQLLLVGMLGLAIALTAISGVGTHHKNRKRNKR